MDAGGTQAQMEALRDLRIELDSRNIPVEPIRLSGTRQSVLKCVT